MTIQISENMNGKTVVTINGLTIVQHPKVDVLHRGDARGERIGHTQRVDTFLEGTLINSELHEFWYNYDNNDIPLSRVTTRTIPHI